MRAFAPSGVGGSGKKLAQARGKFLIDAVEAAVGEDGDDVAGRELRRDGGDDGIGIGEKLSGRALSVESANDVFRMETLGLGNALLLIDAGEDDAVGEAKAGDEIGGEDFAAQRVGARFENGPEARLRINGAKCAKGFANGGGMVGEVLNDGDAVDLGADFKAALDALEGGEGLDDGSSWDALTCGKGRGSGGVEGVVLAGKVHFEIRPMRVPERQNLPTASGRPRGEDCGCASRRQAVKP